MKTVLGLFDDRKEAMRAYSALVAEGYAQADLDILTSDDKDDKPKLAQMRKYIPEPDVTIYLEGVAQGGTIITAKVGNSQASRVAEIMTGFGMINLQQRAQALKAKNADLPDLADTAKRDDVIEVIEEELEVGKEQVERGRMRIYNVVTEREVTEDVGLRDETIRIHRRPVNRAVAVNPNLFVARSFEMVEMDEIATVSKTAVVVEEIYLGKDVAEKVETIKETLRRQDVEIEEIPAVRQYVEYETQFKKYIDQKLASKGVTYEQVAPALRYGYTLATTEPFRSSTWAAMADDAQKLWEKKNPGTWDANKSVVKYAWESIRQMA